MINFLKKHNIFVKKENLPKNILAFYIEINNQPHIILNDILHKEMYDFMLYSCLYYKNNGYHVGKITIFDLEDKEFKPFLYARKELKKNCIAQRNIV